MKIVFCGPPHSGKSVFIANLIDKLPSDAYTIIRACPDGEGTWSNNINQNETSIVRKKGKFTKSFIDDACKAIDNQTNKIVLVDVGGVMSKENEQVFGHCDSFIILSSDKEKKQEWLEFGQRLGLECIASLDSSLKGADAIYSREPFFQGKIVGLKRGEILDNSPIIKAIVSDIVKKSKYAEKSQTKNDNFVGTIIDDTELGFELGYGKEILTEDGTPIKKVKWQEKAIPEIYETMKKKINSNEPVRINGIRANFILSAICKAAKKQNATDICVYDIRSKQYVPIKQLPKKRRLRQSEGLAYNIIENKENIFMDIDITKENYTLEDYKQCILPQLRENKSLYLSGRMPLWLLTSISNSYDTNKIFTFQPGKGFTCVSSIDEKELGTIVDGIDGININQYFEDRKEKQKAKLPAIVDKPGIFSKLKNLFTGYKEKRENVKYIDSSIKSHSIPVLANIETEKNKFQSDLNTGIIPNDKVFEDESKRATNQTEIIPTDIGG